MMPETEEKQIAFSDDEYIFRYKISELEKESICTSREDLLRMQLNNILNIIVPCCGDSEVKIDGFKLMNNRSEIYPLFDPEKNISQINKKTLNNKTPDISNEKKTELQDKELTCNYQSLKNASFYEATIEYITKQLSSILDMVELENHGQRLNVDSFRLKKLSQWVEYSPCDPADILGYLATRCNCSCVFCYNKGCPSTLALVSPSRPPEEEYREAQTRLKYYYPGQNRSLFPSLGTCFEASVHPRFKDLLKEVRKKSNRIIRMATNGISLTEDMVNYLSEFNPLHLDIALHSSSPQRRKQLMRDTSPEIAIKSLSLLKKAKIVYDVVIVPWPEGSIQEMLDDMEKTIAYADKNDARLAQISLPGYSKYFLKKDFSEDSFWKIIADRIRNIRTKYNIPMIIRPALYEDVTYCKTKNIAEIIGVVKGSPSFYSGLKRHDIITKIAGNIIRNRPQARNLLSILQKSEIEIITFEVLRNNINLELTLNMKNFSYPYSKEIDTHLGLIFMGTGLRKGYLESVWDIIKKTGAKNILFLSSFLMKPLLEQLLKESPFLSSANIKIGVPQNQFFGGNICLGDLLVVQDYIDYIKDYVKSTNIEPDLILIPSSPFNLSGWGKDLTGRIFLDIEKETGVPVELIECQTIYD